MTAPVLHHHRGLFHRERFQVRHQLGFVFCEAFEVPPGQVGQDDVELPTRQPARQTASRSTGRAASLRPVEVTLAALVGSRRVCCRNQERIVTDPSS